MGQSHEAPGGQTLGQGELHRHRSVGIRLQLRIEERRLLQILAQRDFGYRLLFSTLTHHRRFRKDVKPANTALQGLVHRSRSNRIVFLHDNNLMQHSSIFHSLQASTNASCQRLASQPGTSDTSPVAHPPLGEQRIVEVGEVNHWHSQPLIPLKAVETQAAP